MQTIFNLPKTDLRNASQAIRPIYKIEEKYIYSLSVNQVASRRTLTKLF